MITSAPQVEGVYASLAEHHDGSYRLRRRGDLVEAALVTTRSPVQAWAHPPGRVLFTLPPDYRPPFPVLRRVMGRPVLADGRPDPTQPQPRPFRLQIEPDGRVRYLDHPEVGDLDYLSYSLELAWGTTPAANDRAILRILDRTRFEDLPDGYHRQSGWWRVEIEDERVTTLKLTDFKATIPPELSQLSQLKSLTLVGPRYKSESGAPWSGPIPPELGQLVNLQILHLGQHQLTGPIPPELGQLTQLTTLNLSDNPLTALGINPHQCGARGCDSIVRLNVNDDVLITLSSALDQLTNLTGPGLYINQLTGPIPPELGQLTNLTDLYLSGNQLSGPIPPELGQLVNLIILDLGRNQLAGPIPPELGQLTNLTYLMLSDNQLAGPIPPELGQLTNLTYLMLSDNQLAGPMPTELSQLVNLQQIYLQNNQLTGCVPHAGVHQNAHFQFSEQISFCSD